MLNTRILTLSTLVLCAFVGTAHADLMYTFNVTGGNVQPFSFSFTVTTFVTSGQFPPFAPFTVTDGTHSWEMVYDEAGSGCPSATSWNFGTAGGSNFAKCGGVPGPPEGQFYLDFGTLPTQTGTFTASGHDVLDFTGGADSSDMSGTLDITSTTAAVPEPTGIALLSTVLAAVGWKMRKRRVGA